MDSLHFHFHLTFHNQKGTRSIAGMAQQLESAPFPSHSLPPHTHTQKKEKNGWGGGGEGGGGGERVNVREKGSIRVAEPSPLSTSYPFDYKRNPFQIQHVQD